MPLHTRIFESAIVQIGTRAVIGNDNNFYSGSIGCAFNYTINQNDYFTGALQFMYSVRITLALNNAARWIAFRRGNPNEYDLGNYAWQNGGRLLERGQITALNTQVLRPSRTIRLSRNESARPKLSNLSQRPRLVISSSATQGIDINGAISIQPLQVQLTGTVASAPPGVITLGGFANPTLPGAAQIQIGRRQAVFDSTDGIFSTTTVSNTSWYQGSQYNSLANRMEPDEFTLFLEPGITGTAELIVYNTGEDATDFTNPHPVYVPQTLPAL